MDGKKHVSFHDMFSADIERQPSPCGNDSWPIKLAVRVVLTSSFSER
jgi:hypothetical protein